MSDSSDFCVQCYHYYSLKVIHVKEEKSAQCYLKGFVVLDGCVSTPNIELGHLGICIQYHLNAKLKHAEIISLLMF